MKKISFVIPCYRSSKTLPGVVAEIEETMQKLPDYRHEIVLINDCSPDDTFETIRQLCRENKRITGISLAKNFGQHAALMAGFHHVSGDIVICLDGSLAENPAPYQRDVGIVAQTMLLAAAEMGLNGCMIGSFAAGELREKLGLPEAIKPQLLLALGEGTDRIVMTDVGEDGSTTYYRDAEDTHYVPKRTLEQLILNP